MDEVEAVAQAIEDQLTAEDGWMVGTPALSSMCRDFALVAIAALDAARGKAEPVAWMYERGEERSAGYRKRKNDILRQEDGWIETPLYAHPPAPDAARGDPVAQVVEFIREQQANAHRHMLEAAHRETASHFAAAFVTLRNLADAIERGEPFNG